MPDTRSSHPDLHTFLDKDIVGSEVLTLPKYEQILGQDLWTRGYVLDVATPERSQSVLHNACPCLTKTRCKQDGYYCPELRRRLNSMNREAIPKTIITAMLRESNKLVASEALIRRGRRGRHERQCAANNAETVSPLGRVSNTNAVTRLVAALSIRQMLPAE